MIRRPVFLAVAVGLGGCTVRSDLLDGDTAASCTMQGTCLALEATPTPESITWRWDAAALPADVAGYMLWLAPSRAQLESGVARVWGADDDANLAWRISPFGPNLVARTTVRGLSPTTAYSAWLWTWDEQGESRVVAEGTGTTAAAATQAVAIFQETEHTGPGVWFDTEDPTTAARSHTGSAALWIDTCAEVAGACTRGGWINMQLGGLSLDLSALTADERSRAFVEAYLSVVPRVATPAPIHYLELSLGTGAGVYFHAPYATLVATTSWQQVQVPFSQFLDDQEAAASVAFASEPLDGVLVGAVWGADADVYVDDVVLRY